jgi:hypothetical protein
MERKYLEFSRISPDTPLAYASVAPQCAEAFGLSTDSICDFVPDHILIHCSPYRAVMATSCDVSRYCQLGVPVVASDAPVRLYLDTIGTDLETVKGAKLGAVIGFAVAVAGAGEENESPHPMGDRRQPPRLCAHGYQSVRTCMETAWAGDVLEFDMNHSAVPKEVGATIRIKTRPVTNCTEQEFKEMEKSVFHSFDEFQDAQNEMNTDNEQSVRERVNLKIQTAFGTSLAPWVREQQAHVMKMQTNSADTSVQETDRTMRGQFAMSMLGTQAPSVCAQNPSIHTVFFEDYMKGDRYHKSAGILYPLGLSVLRSGLAHQQHKQMNSLLLTSLAMEHCDPNTVSEEHRKIMLSDIQKTSNATSIEEYRAYATKQYHQHSDLFCKMLTSATVHSTQSQYKFDQCAVAKLRHDRDIKSMCIITGADGATTVTREDAPDATELLTMTTEAMYPMNALWNKYVETRGGSGPGSIAKRFADDCESLATMRMIALHNLSTSAERMCVTARDIGIESSSKAVNKPSFTSFISHMKNRIKKAVDDDTNWITENMTKISKEERQLLVEDVLLFTAHIHTGSLFSAPAMVSAGGANTDGSKVNSKLYTRSIATSGNIVSQANVVDDAKYKQLGATSVGGHCLGMTESKPHVHAFWTALFPSDGAWSSSSCMDQIIPCEFTNSLVITPEQETSNTMRMGPGRLGDPFSADSVEVTIAGPTPSVVHRSLATLCGPEGRAQMFMTAYPQTNVAHTPPADMQAYNTKCMSDVCIPKKGDQFASFYRELVLFGDRLAVMSDGKPGVDISSLCRKKNVTAAGLDHTIQNYGLCDMQNAFNIKSQSFPISKDILDNKKSNTGTISTPTPSFVQLISNKDPDVIKIREHIATIRFSTDLPVEPFSVKLATLKSYRPIKSLEAEFPYARCTNSVSSMISFPRQYITEKTLLGRINDFNEKNSDIQASKPIYILGKGETGEVCVCIQQRTEAPAY